MVSQAARQSDQHSPPVRGESERKASKPSRAAQPAHTSAGPDPAQPTSRSSYLLYLLPVLWAREVPRPPAPSSQTSPASVLLLSTRHKPPSDVRLSLLHPPTAILHHSQPVHLICSPCHLFPLTVFPLDFTLTSLPQIHTMAEIRRKLVIVGDGACGKTCLLMLVPLVASSSPPATRHATPQQDPRPHRHSHQHCANFAFQRLFQGHFPRGKLSLLVLSLPYSRRPPATPPLQPACLPAYPRPIATDNSVHDDAPAQPPISPTRAFTLLRLPSKINLSHVDFFSSYLPLTRCSLPCPGLRPHRLRKLCRRRRG